ncbi:hypothetical protein Pst134EB_002030 [Puccinia striiformis f. sp. tritici]|nr:hypothetical protein Pst134EB_002030 [Puccinia striiformis f. sp. tritici]
MMDQPKLIMIEQSSQSLSDLVLMDQAIKMCDCSSLICALFEQPNPCRPFCKEALAASEIPVGCVLVSKTTNEILSRGRNRTNETKNACLHAEFDAIAGIHSIIPANKVNWNDIKLYVTVEPCLMCSSALRQIGINLVYFGCSNERFGGCGGVVSIHNELSFSHNLLFSRGYQI